MLSQEHLMLKDKGEPTSRLVKDYRTRTLLSRSQLLSLVFFPIQSYAAFIVSRNRFDENGKILGITSKP